MPNMNINHIKQLVIAFGGLLTVIAMLSGCETQKEEQTTTPTTTDWSAELVTTGGFAGVRHHLSVTGQGEAQFTDHKSNTQISAILTAKQRYDLVELIKNTPASESSKMGKLPSCNDCFQYKLTFQYQQHQGRRSLMDITINQSNAAALIIYLRALTSNMSQQKTKK